MLNKVILMGRLTRDPELRYTGSETAVANFSLAVENGYGDGKKTDFINCVAWSKTAEFAGRLTTRSWRDNSGKTNYVTEVTAEEVKFGETTIQR